MKKNFRMVLALSIAVMLLLPVYRAVAVEKVRIRPLSQNMTKIPNSP